MENVTFIQFQDLQYAVIDRGNGEYTSMLKTDYDEMIAKREASTL